MDQAKLTKVLEEHAKWLQDPTTGKRADFRGADLDGMDLSGANLSWAWFQRASLCEANFRGADLRYANFSFAHLRDADLSQANLTDASLTGTDVANTGVMTFTFTRYPGFYHEGRVQIGCINQTLDNWLKTYDRLGAEYGYTAAELNLYGSQLEALKQYEESQKRLT